MSVNLPDLAQLATRAGGAPRYTSYPTVLSFKPGFDEPALERALNEGAVAGRPLALYVHVPFCAQVCFYCGCNRIITANRKRGEDYLTLLLQEMALLAAKTGKGRRLCRIQFGGGTPTFLGVDGLARVLGAAHRLFDVDPDAETGIEVDPRQLSPGDLVRLRAVGFNRLSIGVQDLDPEVQSIIHRLQPKALTEHTIQAAKALEFRPVSIDLIYGLPAQTEARFRATLDAVVAWRPHRIALFQYAHLPERFPMQKALEKHVIPGPEARLGLFTEARERLLAAGYIMVGMDHFALPEDGLARALLEGSLVRNFQGYETGPEADWLGIGVTAISQFSGAYCQNVRDVESYRTLLAQGRLPLMSGLELCPEDRLRRRLISELMCYGHTDLSLAGADWQMRFAAELDALSNQSREGLVVCDGPRVSLTPTGWLLVRSVAAVFDQYRDRELMSAAL